MLGNAAPLLAFCVFGVARLYPWVLQCKPIIVLRGSGTALPCCACDRRHAHAEGGGDGPWSEVWLEGDIYSCVFLSAS